VRVTPSIHGLRPTGAISSDRRTDVQIRSQRICRPLGHLSAANVARPWGARYSPHPCGSPSGPTDHSISRSSLLPANLVDHSAISPALNPPTNPTSLTPREG